VLNKDGVSKLGSKLEGDNVSHFWGSIKKTYFVTTLILGSRPQQELAKVWAKNEAQESHFMLLGMWEIVREWTSTLPSELPP
jgi:hypothetical protein